MWGVNACDGGDIVLLWDKEGLAIVCILHADTLCSCS